MSKWKTYSAGATGHYLGDLLRIIVCKSSNKWEVKVYGDTSVSLGCFESKALAIRFAKRWFDAACLLELQGKVGSTKWS